MTERPRSATLGPPRPGAPPAPAATAATARASAGATLLMRRAVAWNRGGPWCLVALAVAWGLWELRPELRAVPYLDDSSVHEQMVRFASTRISQGHLPLTSWFPYLGLGSPQFLHYQSLPSMTAGLVGTVIDPNTVFRWSLYLVIALWPLTVYWCGRLFGLDRWTAAAAAAMSPFLASAAGVGYESQAYVWRGYGVWTQLWASWTLPLAWGFTYRALAATRRAILPAVFFIMLTVALHFETGYLALVPLVVWPFMVSSEVWQRLGRALVIAVGALLASAWVIVPVLSQSHWAARNQVLAGTGLENGYGAKQMLTWLFEGRLYDNGRFPVVSILVGVGLVVCVSRWRSLAVGRALVSIWVVTFLMSFGRTTFGSLYTVVPGSSDIFIRRFQMGVQLSGLLIAGVGLVFAGRFALGAVTNRLAHSQRDWLQQPVGRGCTAVLCVALVLGILTPAWIALDDYDAGNGSHVARQATADRAEGPQINQLLSYVRAHPRGRVYAGLPTNWGADFVIGAVPVFKYLESQDIDEVGYTLRTASLMTDPEYWFDETNPGDYPLFGVGYIMLPAGRQPPVAERRVGCAGPYCLWATPTSGYVHVYDTTGVIRATRADLGSQSVPLLESSRLSEARDLTVAFNGGGGPTPTAPDPADLKGRPGDVLIEHADMGAGQVQAVVAAHRRATVVLSASYDPGWKAKVDGREEPTTMVAPAVVGVVVRPGVHDVTFSYNGFGTYPALFLLAVAVLAGLAALSWLPVMRRQIRGIRPGTRDRPSQLGEE